MRDDVLQQNVIDELKWEPIINPAEIGVAVKEGVVTLTGYVTSYAQKLAAERAAKKVRGVRGVAEEIEVRIPSNLITIEPRVKTQEIKDKIREAFKRSAELDANRIQIEASDSKVTLSGKVQSWLEHDEAARIAWAAPGVSTVVNQIAVSS